LNTFTINSRLTIKENELLSLRRKLVDACVTAKDLIELLTMIPKTGGHVLAKELKVLISSGHIELLIDAKRKQRKSYLTLKKVSESVVLYNEFYLEFEPKEPTEARYVDEQIEILPHVRLIDFSGSSHKSQELRRKLIETDKMTRKETKTKYYNRRRFASGSSLGSTHTISN
jgi:hypothetical protein